MGTGGKGARKRRRKLKAAALVRQKGRCFYCKSPLTIGEATMDHRTPVSKGGVDCAENAAACCYSCNQIKSDISESYFFKLITQKTPPRRFNHNLMIVWATRRIWKKTHKACERIEQAAGIVNHRVIEASHVGNAA